MSPPKGLVCVAPFLCCTIIKNVCYICFVAQYDVREDEEQNVKLKESIDLLLAAGYFRARIKGLTPFDKVRWIDALASHGAVANHCAPSLEHRFCLLSQCLFPPSLFSLFLLCRLSAG